MSWTAETREEYEERAAIMEFDGRFPRAEAERLARQRIEQRLNPPAPEQMDLIGPEGTGRSSSRPCKRGTASGDEGGQNRRKRLEAAKA